MYATVTVRDMLPWKGRFQLTRSQTRKSSCSVAVRRARILDIDASMPSSRSKKIFRNSEI